MHPGSGGNHRSREVKSCILEEMAKNVLILLLFLMPLRVWAEDPMPSFTDVPPTREEFIAIEDLKRRGILEGRPDGTFGPDAFVNRAEAVTSVVRAVANVRNLPLLTHCFPDVTAGEWFVQPVCYAGDLEWVSGYPDGTFQPMRTVAKIEFLKILLQAYGVDTEDVSALAKPLAPDASDETQWYFPFLSYALASSMTRADGSGNLNPGAALTRGQVALLTHRFLLYREGERNQALLVEAERDMRFAFGKLDALDIDSAAFAAARVRLMTWGASERIPDAVPVRGAVKLAEALESLVDGYRFFASANFTSALQKAQAAYRSADEADALTLDVKLYTDKIRAYARELGVSIRTQLQ